MQNNRRDRKKNKCSRVKNSEIDIGLSELNDFDDDITMRTADAGDGDGDHYGVDECLYSDSFSDSSSEFGDQQNWSADNEKDFLKTLIALKSRDPKIYECKINFYNQQDFISDDKIKSTAEKSREKEKMMLKDYERKVVLERDGHFSEGEEYDDDDESVRRRSCSYPDNKEELKQALKAALDSEDSDEDDLLKKRIKTEEEETKHEKDYYDWLKGEEGSMAVHDKDLEKLKKRWSKDDELDNDEKFLRDYFLHKKYKNAEENVNSKNRIPTYEEIIRDEEEEDKIDLFEQKYNFRFEEPDQNFLKQYPRTVKEALKKTQTSRMEKRSEKIKAKKEKRRVIEEVEIPFRYRNVVPNSFGLTTDEILRTDDSFLNAWAPISKMSQYRNDEEEERQVMFFERKARNIDKKKRILQQTEKDINVIQETKEKIETEANADADSNIQRKGNKKRRNNELTGKGSNGRRFNANDLGKNRLKAYGVSAKKLRRVQYAKRLQNANKECD